MSTFVSFLFTALMKKILPALFLLLSFFGYAQLDTEHWFAPMAAKSGTGGLVSNLYLSTNETSPFTVNVYYNNLVFATASISKGNPAVVPVPGAYMMGTNAGHLFIPIAKGIYAKGSKKFFANYRFAVTSHAEIITSKGLAGLGTTFYATMAPITGTANYVNSTIGVMATEDNTTVTISGYNPAVVFSNGTSSPTLTFTLNKGQSYIVDAISDVAIANKDGLIGAKIVASRPVTVTNGNFNGIYTNQNFTNNDILMDQAVPVDRLGDLFVLVKGNAPPSSGMETAIIVATEDNTEVYVNGNLLGTVLNEGDYFLLDGNAAYVNQGNNHYNMLVTSTKNIYVYQLLGGTATGTIHAAGGFNYIPPLNCFLPTKVDEIGLISNMGPTQYGTKLNIITQTGAVVTVNGVTLGGTNGPYQVNTNPNWVTYSVPGVNGNITVNSTKAVTAGIAAGSGAVGYGGYFAGFSSVPAISKTGDCYTGIQLQVDNSYDSYQWYLNGVAIPGETSFSINPELYGAGNYTVMVTKNLCGFKVTNEYHYTSCPPIITTTQTIGSCNTFTINPGFTTSTQTIDPALTQIIQAPASGTAIVNPATGIISYTPQNGLTANTQVQFVYYIEGNGSPADFEYFRVILNIEVLQTTGASIATCANADGTGTFDLTSVTVSNDSGAAVTYFSDAAFTNAIPNPANYTGPAGMVYASVISTYGCAGTAPVQLTINPAPNINTNNFNAALCDENLDGTVPVDFTVITPQIVNNAAQFTTRYYLNQADATAGNANTLPANWTYNAPTTVYVRVDTITGNCPPVFGQIDFTIASPMPLLAPEITTTLCDPDGNGSENANLTDYIPSFTAAAGVTATFHSSLADAQNGNNAINPNQLVTGTGIYYIRFSSNDGCPNTGKITLNLETLQVTPATLSACGNAAGTATFNLSQANVTTNAGVTFTYFTDAALTAPVNNPNAYNTASATVYVQVSTQNGCTSSTSIQLNVIPLPNINTANFNGALCDDNFDGIVTVDFNTITPQIVNNAGAFTVRYYATLAAAQAGGNNNLPNNWNYNATTIVYVRVDSTTGNCTPAYGQITFSIGNRIQLLTNEVTTEVCDNDLSGDEQVNLNGFIAQFTTAPGVSASYHLTLADAQNDVNAVNSNQNITGPQTFYVRFESNNGCPNTAELNISLKSPRASETLKDVSICPGTSVILDAGAGFTGYLWSTGATTQTITATIGNYYVDLSFNGCVYRQYVQVLPAEQPVITKIEVKGDIATIHVSGGTPPYEYSLDGVIYQTSNVFMGLSKGTHTVYVRSAEKCRPVMKEFLVLNLINAITPNGDGVNDVLDYSDLRTKENVSIQIFDRYGSVVYQSSAKKYIWDGKVSGQSISSGTYWYVLKWTDPDTKENSEYQGWILLKNRE